MIHGLYNIKINNSSHKDDYHIYDNAKSILIKRRGRREETRMPNMQYIILS
jgi:hypothetical protein